MFSKVLNIFPFSSLLSQGISTSVGMRLFPHILLFRYHVSDVLFILKPSCPWKYNLRIKKHPIIFLNLESVTQVEALSVDTLTFLFPAKQLFPKGFKKKKKKNHMNPLGNSSAIVISQ